MKIQLRKMTDAEDAIYQIINNSKELHTWVNNISQYPVSSVLREMSTIVRHHVKNKMPIGLSIAGAQNSLVFVNLIESMGLINNLHDSFMEHFDQIPEVKKEPGIGDIVTHVNNSKLEVIIVSQHLESSKWNIEHTGNGLRKGIWQKRNCILKEKKKEITDLKNVQEEIIEHLENATKSFKKVAENLPPVTYKLKPEKTMTHTIVKRTEVNGVDVNDMSASSLVNAIEVAKKDIKHLTSVKENSLYLKQEIKRLNKFVKNTVKLLDDKFAVPETK